MPLFRFKSANADGEVVEGEMEAADREALVERLRGQGQITIRAELVAAGRSEPRSSPAIRWWQRGGVSQAALTEFTLELSTLLEAGVPLERALALIAQVTENPALGELARSLRDDIRHGMLLSGALAARPRVFPALYVNLVRAGESAGALDAALARLTEFLRRSRELRETVLSALLYPIILTALAIASVVIILTVVIPRFEVLFEDAGVALPWTTQVLLSTGAFLNSYGWLLPVAALGIFGLIRWQSTRPGLIRLWHIALLGSPLLGGLVARYETANFCRTLGTTLASGVPVLDAVDIARGAVGNSAMAQAFAGAPEGVRDGRGLAAALLESARVPRLAGELAAVGQEAGNLAAMLLKAAEILEREVRVAVQRLVTALEPALIVALAVVVGAIIFSVLNAVLRIHDVAV